MNKKDRRTTPSGTQILSKQASIRMARYQSVVERKKRLSRGEFQH
jgi:hypothetical protein